MEGFLELYKNHSEGGHLSVYNSPNYCYFVFVKMDYKFEEDVTLSNIKDYIDSTYDQHYASGKYQATDMIVDAGFGEGFCIGNINEIRHALRQKRRQNKELLKNHSLRNDCFIHQRPVIHARIIGMLSYKSPNTSVFTK
jgi:hypothetical protein